LKKYRGRKEGTVMDKKTLFLDKYCRAELRKNNFVLNGYVRAVDEFGILFETRQKTAFINWDDLLELVPIKEEVPR